MYIDLFFFGSVLFCLINLFCKRRSDQIREKTKKSMRKCELCRLPARLYCESDQASLCAGCDLKVHEANFLVARHSRTLLCRTCQSVTPWMACGARLGNTVTECEKCVGGQRSDAGEDADEAVVTDYDDEEEEEEGSLGDGSDEEVEEEEEGENQVVPWAASSASSSTSDATSFSSSVYRSRTILSSNKQLKRMREYDDVVTDGRIKCLQIK